MSTHTHRIRGSTAPGTPPAPRPRRRLGTALRAVGVFADTAFRVVVLGTDGIKQAADTRTGADSRSGAAAHPDADAPRESVPHPDADTESTTGRR